MAYVKGATTDSPVIVLGDLDFNDLKSSLRDYLQNSNVFTDYDFEGSALATLLDLLAYNSTFYSYYANMIANESFLDTALRRDSIGSLVKPLSYVPTSRRGARAEIKVTSSTDKTLRYGDPFFGGGLNWTPVQTYKVNGTRRIEIIQGNRVESYPNPSIVDHGISHQRFKIPHTEIDTTTVKVEVNEGNGWNVWKNVNDVEDNVAGVTAGGKVFFLTSSYDSGYEIYFGDNIVGKAPVHNSEVKFDYVISAGEEGNGVTSFTTGVNGIIVDSTVTASVGGSDPETVESIRKYAPTFFQTQGRAVTRRDYESLLRQDNKGIIAKVWGGEDNDPPQYGRVFITAIGDDGSLLTDKQKEDIITFARNKAVVSILPEFVDPNTIQVVLDGPVWYNLDETTSSVAELEDKVISFIDNFPLSTFDEFFHFATFAGDVLQLDSGIVSESLIVYLRKAVSASTSSPVESLSIRFGNPIAYSGGIPGDILTSNEFMALVDGVERGGYLENGGSGIIRHKGTDGQIINDNAGSINIDTGSVQIDGVTFVSNFYIQVLPREKNVTSKIGLILTLINDSVELVSVI